MALLDVRQVCEITSGSGSLSFQQGAGVKRAGVVSGYILNDPDIGAIAQDAQTTGAFRSFVRAVNEAAALVGARARISESSFIGRAEWAFAFSTARAIPSRYRGPQLTLFAQLDAGELTLFEMKSLTDALPVITAEFNQAALALRQEKHTERSTIIRGVGVGLLAAIAIRVIAR